MAATTFKNTVNFGQTVLDSTGVAAGGTSFGVVDGSALPSSNFLLTIYDMTNYNEPSDDPNREIVLVGSRSGNTCSSVTKAQEGTSDSNHNTSGVQYGVVVTFTSGMYDAITGAVNNIEDATYVFPDMNFESGAVLSWNSGDVTITHSSNQLAMAGGNLSLNGDFILASGNQVGIAITPTALLHVHTGTGTLGAYDDYMAIETDTGTADRGGLILSNRIDANAANHGFKITSTFNNSSAANASFGWIDNDDLETWSGDSISTAMMQFYYGGGATAYTAINSIVRLGNVVNSLTNLIFDIDSDNNGTSSSFQVTKDGQATTIMNLSENGDIAFAYANGLSVGGSNAAGNVGIEIGNSGSTGGVAYMDFHYGVTGSEDYNIRIQNNADAKLNLACATYSGSIFDIDLETMEFGGASSTFKMVPPGSSQSNPSIQFENQVATTDAAINPYQDANGTDIWIMSNCYLSGGTTTRYNTGEESSYIVASRTGNLYFGTGGTGATATTALTIDTNGDLILASGNIIESAVSTANALTLDSSGNGIWSARGTITVDIDADNNGTAHVFQVRTNGATQLFEIDESGNINIAASANLEFNGTAILSDSAGTMTLSNIDALDATTESTIDSALAANDIGIRYVGIVVTDYTTDTATGDGQAYFHIPSGMNGMDLIEVHAEVITAGTTGTTDIQIHNVTQAADMLSTKLTIDSGETGSDTAATPAVIDTSNDDVATNDVIRIDVDAVSTTAAQGLILTLGFQIV